MSAVATTFDERCGLRGLAAECALRDALERIATDEVELVRIGWCDLHGTLRSKAFDASAVERALRDGVGMVSTLLLKDSSCRTAYQVFEQGGTANLPGFGQANNVLLMPDPTSYTRLPWSPRSAWLRAQPWFQDGTPVEIDTRRVLQRALDRLHAAGYEMRCGLEIEMHIYRLADGAQPPLDVEQAAWPGPAPRVELIHPGYSLLADDWFDLAEEPLRIVQHTARGLGLPLSSLEIELGPSQVEAVFDVTDALTAADNMVLFRHGVRMALRRAGYHATFMSRPPFPNIMASGWHLHQSLVDRDTKANAFSRAAPAPGSSPLDAAHVLSGIGEHFLAGLLEHARAIAVFGTPTVNGYGRFRPNALAPQRALWGADNRGAMLRVVGRAGDGATRIENRAGEPCANPYLYIAAQIHAGLDGIERGLRAPRATEAPYADPADASDDASRLPSSLAQALAALQADDAVVRAFGPSFVDYLVRIKQQECDRHRDAEDKVEFERREYFARL